MGYIRRYMLFFRLHKYDMVYIQRETGPLGLPIIAWALKFVFRKKYVFDFDDAIWIPNFSENNAKFHKLKMYKKTSLLIRWAHVCCAGNKFLSDYAIHHNPNTRILPTVVDTERYHNVTKEYKSTSLKPVIGWTGTHSTMKYLEFLFPILCKLEQEFEFELLVISNAPPSELLKSLTYVEWSKETEIKDLMKIDLGLMPLEERENDSFSKGKCGFKLIQYLSLGIPAIASDVGVNREIITHGVNGYLCADINDWQIQLRTFLETPSSMSTMGKNGRQKVIERYSAKANLSAFIALFKIDTERI